MDTAISTALGYAPIVSVSAMVRVFVPATTKGILMMSHTLLVEVVAVLYFGLGAAYYTTVLVERMTRKKS